MGTTLLTDSNIFPHLRRTLCTSLFASAHVGGYRSLRHRFLYKACISSNTDLVDLVARRKIMTYTAAISLSLAPIPSVQQPAKSEESVLSEWERVYLPIDPGVVLLDVAFVPDDLNHGFLLGTRQTILETKDGGNTWFPRSIPSAEDEDFNYRFNSISFRGKEGWIVGKPAILLYTSNAGESWERIPLSSQLPGDMVYIKATDEKSAEMVTDQGAIYTTSNRGTVSSGISGASYYTGTFNTVNRSPDGRYVAVSSRGNFYLTWEPGQPYWQPHNRAIARRIQNMGWRADGGLWLLVRGGGLYLSKGTGINEEFEEVPVQSRGFGILDVGYRSKDEAWAAGGSGILLRTTNGGKTWARDKAADNIAANLYSVKFIGDNKGFVLGNDGVLLRYLGFSGMNKHVYNAYFFASICNYNLPILAIAKLSMYNLALLSDPIGSRNLLKVLAQFFRDKN
ncbi:hypothetical protein IEQ34_001421 [Dendrobium chrysotoxum]|nr:hypothetical protein IEQ34_001421 [Dendrobium chrysotoxum]